MNMNENIEVEATVISNTVKPVRSWFNHVASALWAVLVVVSFPVRLILRPVTNRVADFVLSRWERFKARPAILNIAQTLGGLTAAWLLYLLTCMLGFHPNDFSKETGKRASYWSKQAMHYAADGEIVDAAGAGFNYIRNAERPNRAVRAGSAIWNFFN
jgi:hypothetical protein